MAEPARPVLVIDDGGVASLVASLLVDDPASTRIWFSSGNARAKAVSRNRSQRLAFAHWSEGPTPLGEAETLLAGLREAQRVGAGVVVWPGFAGDDLEAMSIAISRVRLLDELIAIECVSDAPSPHIETPLIDLDARRICDLAVDLDAPLDTESVWWCEGAATGVCGQCEACRLWQGAIAAPRSWERAEATAGA